MSSAGESGSAATAATRLISQLSARANRIVSARHDPGNTWIKLFTRLQTNCAVLRVALSFHYGRQEVAAACQSEQGCADPSLSLRVRRSSSLLLPLAAPGVPPRLRLPAPPPLARRCSLSSFHCSSPVSSHLSPAPPFAFVSAPLHHHHHLPLPSVSCFLPPDWACHQSCPFCFSCLDNSPL